MNEAHEIRVLQLDLGEELRGGQRQVLYLARSLARMREAGHAVECLVACPRASALAEVLEKENLPCLPLPGRGIANPALLFSLVRAVKKRGIQIIHTHDARAATVGAWLKRMHENLVLIHARRVSYPMRKGMRGKKYHVADAVVGVSYEIARDLVESGVPAHRVHTIHSGIDPALYPRRQARNDGRFVFGAVGALSPQKGFDVLLQAMGVLSEMDTPKPWEVRIIGGGALFEPLMDQARELGVLDRLALFGKQDSKLFLPQFDALLVPSMDGEGSNAVIKEGWAVGVPVVCSSLTANEELVTDKHDGLVVHKGNPLALGTAMVRMMTEPDLAGRLIEAGRETLKAFTADRMAELTFSLYQDLLGIPSDDESGKAPSVQALVQTAAPESKPVHGESAPKRPMDGAAESGRAHAPAPCESAQSAHGDTGLGQSEHQATVPQALLEQVAGHLVEPLSALETAPESALHALPVEKQDDLPVSRSVSVPATFTEAQVVAEGARSSAPGSDSRAVDHAVLSQPEPLSRVGEHEEPVAAIQKKSPVRRSIAGSEQSPAEDTGQGTKV